MLSLSASESYRRGTWGSLSGARALRGRRGRHSGRQGDAAPCPWSPASSPHTPSRNAHGQQADANQSPGWGPDGCESPLLGSALWPAGGAAPGECPERCNPPDCHLYGGHVTERQEVINLNSVFLMRKSFRNPSSCITIITRVLPPGTPNQKQATSQRLPSSMSHSPSPHTLGP